MQGNSFIVKNTRRLFDVNLSYHIRVKYTLSQNFKSWNLAIRLFYNFK